ncbi:MAG: tetratricopeptide repeat protein [Acidobacteria bacterium]|nr:tetratricopeptide repeat protein [Acidobacteriota bacterium]
MLSPVQSTFTIVGSVRDQSGHPVGGVRLSVIDENYQPIRTQFIDTSGQFTINGLGQGKFTFRIETTGTNYEEQTQQLELQAVRRLGGKETFPLDFVLKYKKGKDPNAAAGSVFAQEVPGNARKEFDRGVGNLKSNKSEQAIASLKKAVEIFPDYYDALELLGTEYLKNGQHEAALEAFTTALRVNKRSFKCTYGIGVANLKLNRLPEAVEWLEKAAQLEPNSTNVQMMLGLAYGTGGTFDKAKTAFEKALQLGGAAAAEAHFYLAGLYNKQDKFHEAWTELELYLKEGKNLKDPGQIKAMIEKLKEREKNPPVPGKDLASAALSTPVQVQGPSQLAAQPENTETAPAEEPEPKLPVFKPIEPLAPAIAALVNESAVNGGAMHRRLLDFTYKLKKTRRILDSHGKPIAAQEQIFEAFPIRGEHVLIKLSTDGIPSRKLADDRSRAAKQLEEAERERQNAQASAQEIQDDYVSAGVSGVYAGKSGYVSISLSELLRDVEFFSPRTETVGDRATLVLNFRPRSGLKLQTQHAYIGKLVGTLWIDEADKTVLRLEGWPASEAAFDLIQAIAPRNDAALIYQQARQPNGMWFPTQISMNANGRRDLFSGLNWEVVFEFSNYQQFNTQADDAKIKNPIKNP